MTKKEQIIQEIFKKIELQYPDFSVGKHDTGDIIDFEFPFQPYVIIGIFSTKGKNPKIAVVPDIIRSTDKYLLPIDEGHNCVLGLLDDYIMFEPNMKNYDKICERLNKIILRKKQIDEYERLKKIKEDF
jgi:hypothetical protein